MDYFRSVLTRRGSSEVISRSAALDLQTVRSGFFSAASLFQQVAMVAGAVSGQPLAKFRPGLNASLFRAQRGTPDPRP